MRWDVINILFLMTIKFEGNTNIITKIDQFTERSHAYEAYFTVKKNKY